MFPDRDGDDLMDTSNILVISLVTIACEELLTVIYISLACPYKILLFIFICNKLLVFLLYKKYFNKF